MSVRLGVAREAGFDEMMAEKISHYEESDLLEHQKAALRLADAFVIAPGAISSDLRAQVRMHFTDEQIVELMLDMSKWSTQKLSVALGTDDPVTGKHLSLIDFDEAGSLLWGPTLTTAFMPAEQPMR
mgnify:CR=1 FL=1